jgi:hypothetical protein
MVRRGVAWGEISGLGIAAGVSGRLTACPRDPDKLAR